MLQPRFAQIFSGIVLLLTLLACNISASDVVGLAEQAISDPTPIPSPTPQGDMIVFNTLTYRQVLSDDEFIPGTGVRYIGATGNSSYTVEIDGLQADKRAADSLSWRGIVAPAVFAAYDLRLTSSRLSRDIVAVGPVEITILTPNPTQLPNTEPTPASVVYEELVINYNVPVGRTIPGTTLSYVGRAEQGAELAGTTNYPYYQQGDSLVWQGQLRDNVILRYDLRFIFVSDDSVQLAGVAKLWIYD